MSRKYTAKKKKSAKYDPICGSRFITMLVNRMMVHGKKSLAYQIFYRAAIDIKREIKTNPISVFRKALYRATPRLIVKIRKKKRGKILQIPKAISFEKGALFGIRWLLEASRYRSGKSMASQLSAELTDAALRNRGKAIRKKEENHKIARANRTLAHIRSSQSKNIPYIPVHYGVDFKDPAFKPNIMKDPAFKIFQKKYTEIIIQKILQNKIKIKKKGRKPKPKTETKTKTETRRTCLFKLKRLKYKYRKDNPQIHSYIWDRKRIRQKYADIYLVPEFRRAQLRKFTFDKLLMNIPPLSEILKLKKISTVDKRQQARIKNIKKKPSFYQPKNQNWSKKQSTRRY